MECPRCSSDVARGSRACMTCGFDLLAAPGAAPGATSAGSTTADPGHADGWRSADRGLRLFVVADLAQNVGVALALIPILTGMIQSLTVFAVLLSALIVVTGAFRFIGLQRFSNVPPRSGAGAIAYRVKWVALAAVALQVATIAVTMLAMKSGDPFEPPSKLWTALESPLHWGVAVCGLAVPIAVATACGMIASFANDLSLVRHARWVSVIVVVLVGVGVVVIMAVGASTTVETAIGVLGFGWSVFFWVTCWRTARVARKFASLGADVAASFAPAAEKGALP